MPEEAVLNEAEVEQTSVDGSGVNEQEAAVETDAESEGAGNDVASTDGADDGAERKRQSGIEKRIAKLTAEKYGAIEEAHRLRLELEATKRAQQQAEEPPAVDPAKPRKDQFANDEEYFEAVVEYRLQRERIDREVREKTEAFVEKLKRGKDEIPDFDEVVTPDLPAGPAVTQAIFVSDNPAIVVHHLAKNPDLLAKLNKLSAVEAAVKVGELHTTLVAKRKAPEPQRSDRRAPAPPSKIAAAAKAENNGPPPNATDAEYAAWWRQHYAS